MTLFAEPEEDNKLLYKSIDPLTGHVTRSEVAIAAISIIERFSLEHLKELPPGSNVINMASKIESIIRLNDSKVLFSTVNLFLATRAIIAELEKTVINLKKGIKNSSDRTRVEVLQIALTAIQGIKFKIDMEDSTELSYHDFADYAVSMKSKSSPAKTPEAELYGSIDGKFNEFSIAVEEKGSPIDVSVL